MQKTYTIDISPITWQRAGVNTKSGAPRFFDKQAHEKNAYGIYLQRDHGNAPLFDGPLSLSVIFYLPIPALLRNRSKYPHQKADLDNYLKFLLDSGTGIIYTDDRLICQCIMRKQYDEHPRTVLIIEEME
jgi:Holliday junction resolvase RusA-like endonuclease